jgi:hypothetical protein
MKLQNECILSIQVQVLGNPLVDGRGSKLAHEDVPMIEVRVELAVGILWSRKRGTFRGSKYLKKEAVRIAGEVGATQVGVLGESGLDL